MLQHVSIEVPPAEVEATVEFWRLLGFARVPAPEPIADFVTWLERDGTQIHVLHTDAATVPQLGHAAVVVDDFDGTLAALADGGFEAEETRALWGARRAFAVGPAGHRVELMDAPPPPS
jgi:catechol 2,3-dioxygenase-like lactoylglutathione lyase family enzyme